MQTEGLPAGLLERLGRVDAIDLVTRLTLLLLLFTDWVSGDWWPFKVPLRVLAIAGLVLPPLHRNPVLWGLVATTMLARSTWYWWTQDNHVFLLTWWMLAVALSLSLPRPEQGLARNGRLLLGLAFAFATLWKAFLSPDFADGAYFHYTFLTDARFADFAALGGGLSETLHAQNQRAIATLIDTARDVHAVVLETTPRLSLIAVLVTWWTLALEGGIALAFLWPLGRGPSRYRHAALIVFAATTYLVASNVSTFGWGLLVMGLAQCEPGLPRTRVLYCACMLLVLSYGYVPVLALIRSLLGL